MILDSLQFLACRHPVNILSNLLKRGMRRRSDLNSRTKHPGAQCEECRLAVKRVFDLLAARFARAHMVGHHQQFRAGEPLTAVIYYLFFVEVFEQLFWFPRRLGRDYSQTCKLPKGTGYYQRLR